MDGFIADRDGRFEWSEPSEELFRFHLQQVRELGGFLLGRRLYQTMLAWETDASLRDTELGAAFADAWSAIPKVVFSRTIDEVQGNARLAQASVADEVAAALGATDRDVGIGGAGLAATAFELGLVDELRMFRYPIVVGGGTSFLPPVTESRSPGTGRDRRVRLAGGLRALPDGPQRLTSGSRPKSHLVTVRVLASRADPSPCRCGLAVARRSVQRS